MKLAILISILALLESPLFFVPALENGGYDSNYVSFGTKQYDGEEFHVVSLKRKDSRVKAKYFAAKIDGKSIESRYNLWSSGKNVICYSSGAYMSSLDQSTAGIVGLTIDNGKVINLKLKTDGLDAFVVVYPNGEIEVKDLGEGTITFSGTGEDKSFDMTKENFVARFIDWAKENKLTVFQTHLLGKDNVLKVGSNCSPDEAERRFLIVAENSRKERYHFIIHKPTPSTLYDGSKAVLEYIKSRRYKVLSMINLDTGAQDVFGFYSSSGNKSTKLQGKLDINKARNLIVYYFE